MVFSYKLIRKWKIFSEEKIDFRAGEINGQERLQKLNTYTVITAVLKGSMGIFKCYEQRV